MDILLFIIGMIILVALGTGTGLVLYRFFRQYTIGLYWGAIVAGIFGAVIGNFVFTELHALLQAMSVNVNISAGILGAIIFVKLLNFATPSSYK